MKANYATDGSPGGTVTLYRSSGGFGSDPAVSVAVFFVYGSLGANTPESASLSPPGGWGEIGQRVTKDRQPTLSVLCERKSP